MAHTIPVQEWRKEAAARYGEDSLAWKFRCPCCGTVASVQDYKDAGGNPGAVAFNCIGRVKGAQREAFEAEKKAGPCNYTGGGLFRLNPIIVIAEDGEKMEVFDFADRPLVPEKAGA